MLLLLVGCATNGNKTTDIQSRVRFHTSMGDFVVQVDTERAPKTAMNFTRYVHDGFYDDTLIHRVIEGGLIQGGGYTSETQKKTDGQHPAIAVESNSGLLNQRGTIAMYRVMGLSRSTQSQFYINLSDNTALDEEQPDGSAYLVFGKVIEGMDVVDLIAATPVGTHPDYAAGHSPLVPKTPVVVKTARFEQGSAGYKSVRHYVEDLKEKRIRAEEEDVRTRAAQLVQRIEEIEARAGAKLTTAPSGVRYVDIEVGEGAIPEPYERVEVHYKAMLVDGTVFDNTYVREHPLRRTVSTFVPALQEALTAMSEGGIRVLVVPPEVGFGPRGMPGKVPPNSTVIFELELLQILAEDQPTQ